MASRRPLLVVHGYSDEGNSFQIWADKLRSLEKPVADINICTWISLSNEITIKDVADGFDRALKYKGLDGKEFDAVVHSTGMLVLRSWLTNNPATRLGKLKHLIGLAPATFGSPLAYEGQSIVGSIFKGNKDLKSPDFLAAGDQILDALELGSRFTWDLSHIDLLDGQRPFYGLGSETPYIFVFCGTKAYGGLRTLGKQTGDRRHCAVGRLRAEH